MKTNLFRIAALTALALSVCASGELVDRVAAVVNGEVIPLSEVEQRAAADLSRAAAKPDAKARTEMRRQVLMAAVDQLIGEKLLEVQIKELNIEVSEQEIDMSIDDVRKQQGVDGDQFEQVLRNEGFTMATYREFMRKHLSRFKLINLKVRNKVNLSDEDLKSEYTRWSKMESEDPEVHARHIVIQTPANANAASVDAAKKKAEMVAKEAKKPGADFAALAKQYGEGANAEEGGDLGFFRRGVMDPEFERVAFALKPGQVSDPIRLKFGFHIIKVEERRAVPAKGFEEVKEQLKTRLLQTQLEKYTTQYVQELRQSAVVEVKL
jgi:peptidyl-prolyl cis-trans isomerase SurA